MPLVTFQPSGKSVEVGPGVGLLEAASLAGVMIESPCGGKGTCGKCIVRVVSGEVDSESLGVLSREVVAQGTVLACRTRVLNTPVTVEVPEQSQREGGKFTSVDDDLYLVQKELFPTKCDYNPLAIKWTVNVPEPQLEDGLSDLDRLRRAIQKDWGKKEIIFPMPVLRNLADTIREEDGKVTVTLIRDTGKYHVINIEPGDLSTLHYGIAVDVGTTTVAVQLVFLPLGEIVATRTDYNNQLSCGLDVISRINYARTPERLKELSNRVLESINHLIEQVTKSHRIKPEEICNAVISGNTTMIHLLLGLNPEYIRLEPYTPTILEAPYLTAMDVGVNIHPQSWVYLSPSVGSYVGGDITAGLLCTALATDSEEISLFIDIGTNGELVIGNNEFMMTCACSAGPAFEGGGIDCGMRAALGAIERVEINPETGTSSCQVIGNVKPKGICGSGMISLLANLLLTGWLDPAGKLNREKISDSIKVDGRRAYYILASAEASGTGKELTISEHEIENILRAKAAIYAACCLMLEQVGLGFEDLSTIFIAGGFGRFLDLDKAMVLGLIPDLPKEKFKYLGNSSLTGTYMVLVSQEFKQKQLELAQRMTYIELNTDPSYMDRYTSALFLPHTELERFPTVKQLLDGK